MCKLQVDHHQDTIRKLGSKIIKAVRLIMHKENQVVKILEALDKSGLVKTDVWPMNIPSDEELKGMDLRSIMKAFDGYSQSLFETTMGVQGAEEFMQKREKISEEVWKIVEGETGATTEVEEE